MENIPSLQCGKMYREHSAATKEKISEPCWKTCRTYVNQEFLFLDLRKEDGQNPAVFSETDGALLGEQWTLNIGESPSVAVESHLSWILEDDAPEKYYLSAKACQGILRRAEKRGKSLPSVLEKALMDVIQKQ